ncbi:MAG: homoserine O-acetyltransferase [Cellulomonadaceae bacterium]|jgi:homoserine O-acetyltransferase|nr:homoserine O-acetyltransferase [Cellulomonadaceae bacterium]
MNEPFDSTSEVRPRPGSSAGSLPSQRPPVPASAAWKPGDPPGNRQFAAIGDLTLETGIVLPQVTMAYETFGTLNAQRTNAILVQHALTGDSHVTGPAGEGHPTAGWWEDLVGPGKPIDTNRAFVVVPNVLGGCQGTTGPASFRPVGSGSDPATSAASSSSEKIPCDDDAASPSRWGAGFPRITTRDQVMAEVRLAQQLGISEWELVVGASMGGLRALEWAVMGPEQGIAVRNLIALATTAATSADQIAWAHPQIAAITSDVGYHDGDYYDQPDGHGPHRGLAIARQIAHITYRSAAELDGRFAREPQGHENPMVDGRFAVQSYLDYHGDKIGRRFDANSYITLTRSILTHDLGRGRGGVEAALATIKARTLVVGVDSDRLFPLSQSARIATGIRDADSFVVHTPYGHDGFLIEFDQLVPRLRAFIESGVAKDAEAP